MRKSNNQHVKFIAKYAEKDRTSIIGENIDVICRNHNLHDRNVISWFSNVERTQNTVDSDEAVLFDFIRELCLCREETWSIPQFSSEEIQIMIDCLSTE